MGSKQSSVAPGSLVRRLGRWARGDKYMVGAYPPEWQERAPSDVPVVPLDQPTVAPLDRPTVAPLDRPTVAPLDQPTVAAVGAGPSEG